MTLPNFLCIGVQRAATTWLHKCLEAHPDVFVPDEKELHFFNFHWNQGIAWYEGHFDSSGDASAVGEITPNYLHEAPLERICETLPDVRLIVILREPVSRAFSAYRLLHEKLGAMTFQKACETESYLVDQSLYAEKLEQLYSFFPREQVLVALYDEINTDPVGVYQNVCRHLNVKQIPPPPELNQTFNHILFPRTQALFSKMHLTWTLDLIKRTPIADTIKRFAKNKQKIRLQQSRNDDQISPELRRRFDNDIERLETLIERDLSNWKSKIAAIA
ncbi:MAG: sulfotransferase [Planctomycetaceae bacterium]|nr:sulfotransferase [Planctomycetaceae bacterium]